MGCTGWSYDEVLAEFRKFEGNERLERFSISLDHSRTM
jgi:hypothetical protein